MYLFMIDWFFILISFYMEDNVTTMYLSVVVFDNHIPHKRMSDEPRKNTLPHTPKNGNHEKLKTRETLSCGEAFVSFVPRSI